MHRLILLFIITIMVLVGTACESTRKRQRETMTNYTFIYSHPENAFPSLKDRAEMNRLEREGWVPAGEERSVDGQVVTVKIHYTR